MQNSSVGWHLDANINCYADLLAIRCCVSRLMLDFEFELAKSVMLKELKACTASWNIRGKRLGSLFLKAANHIASCSC